MSSSPRKTKTISVVCERGRSPSPRRRRQEKKYSSERANRLAKSEIKPDIFCALPREHQNLEVQESDGNFFESFTALSWKQENKRLRATNEQDDTYTPSELQFGVKPKIQLLAAQEFQLLYIEVLYTIKHKIGATTGGYLPFIQDLYQYAQDAFGMSPEDHARFLARATEEKPPILILNASIIEAKGLEAKDADGYSDPYCMLGIRPALSTPSSSRIPAKLIRTTAVKRNTLNPIWNERFRFDLEDVNTDCLHLDIWDHDDESSVFEAARNLNEVSSLKGLRRYFKQIAQSARKGSSGSVDDFLGSVNIPLIDLPSVGVNNWYPLEGRSAKSSVQGYIKLKLNLATRENNGIPEEDNWNDIKQHEDLMCVFIENEIKKVPEGSYKWTGQLSQAAMTILHQHAIQGDITEIQQLCCFWGAVARKHMEHPLDYAMLYNHLKKIDDVWEPGSISREQEESLADSFNTFIEYCLSLLRKQRSIFPTNNKVAVYRVEYLLRCLTKIHSMKAFKYCCPFQKDLHFEIIKVVKHSTSEWYDSVWAQCESAAKTGEDTLQCLINLTNTLNTDMYRSVLFYNKIYTGITNVEYSYLVYRTLEKRISVDINTALEVEMGQLKTEFLNIDESGSTLKNDSFLQTGTTLFELYLELQEFCKFKNHIPESEWETLSITKFYEWFRFAVEKWLLIAQQKSMKRVRKAIELDKVSPVDSHAKHSSSAVDVCCCFSHMVEFWKQLAWPEPKDAFIFVTQLTEDICYTAVLYAELIHERLAAAGYYVEEGQFDVTEESTFSNKPKSEMTHLMYTKGLKPYFMLCITINNIEHVRKCLRPLSESLEFLRIEEDLSKSSKLDSPRINLYSVVNRADQKMVDQIKKVVDRIADKMRPDIKKDVFHMNWAPESVPADEAIVDLMEYLDSNLLTLNENLLKGNFNRILESIWVEVLEEFKEVLLTEEMRMPMFYQRMYDALTLLVEFFYANEKGLTMETIISDNFQSLRDQLALHKQDTRDLIELFYQEKLDQQEQTEMSNFGILKVRVFYKYDSQTLLVEIEIFTHLFYERPYSLVIKSPSLLVLSAKDLIPLDANGLSDPFVLIHLCPEHNFPNLTVQQTQIVKKSLNPIFDETFEFPVSPEQCKHKGGVLLFIVMDHDFMFQNDIAGEAFIPLSEMAGVNGAEVSGFEALNVLSLPLMQPKHKRRGAFDVLVARTWDKEAQDFTKKRMKIEEQAS